MVFIKDHPQYNSGKTHFKKGVIPWNTGKANWVKYICKICDSEFIRKTSPSRIGRNKYCSRKCQNKIGNLNLQRIGGKPTGINLPKCLDCGKELTNYNNKYCKRHAKTGSRSYSWKGGITPQTIIDRNRFASTVRGKVFERDNYTCQICGDTKKRLTVDHIQPWAEYVELRFNIDNCRTLCAECHYFITYHKPMLKDSKWGYPKGRRTLQ